MRAKKEIDGRSGADAQAGRISGDNVRRSRSSKESTADLDDDYSRRAYVSRTSSPSGS